MEQSPANLPRRTTPVRPARNDETDMVLVPRSSNEITTSIATPGPQPARLRKQRSAANMRAASQPITTRPPDEGPVTPAKKPINHPSVKPKPRNSSLRNVVRRIFGIRSKEVEVKKSSPPRHAYHRSASLMLQVILFID